MASPLTDPSELRDVLSQSFSEYELFTLFQDLAKADYTEIPKRSEGKAAIAREIVSYFERRQYLPEVWAYVWRKRPHLDPNAKAAETAAESPNTPTLAPEDVFFVGGRITDPVYFHGRAKILREVRSLLSKRSNVSIIGEAEIGKSSLLYHLWQTGPDWLPDAEMHYVDLQGVLNESDFCVTLLSHLGHDGNTAEALKAVLNGYIRNRQRVILLLDELERLSYDDIRPEVLHLLRSFAQQAEFKMCVATRRPLATVFPVERSGKMSPFHNIFTIKPLSAFDEVEAREFVRTRLAKAGIAITESELVRLVRESGGHPSHLQTQARKLMERD